MVFCFSLLVCLNIICITKIICKQGVQNSFLLPTSFNETNLHADHKLDQVIFSGISQKPSLSHPFILSVPLGTRNAIAQLLWRQMFLEAGNKKSSMKACNYKISSLSFAHMNYLEDVWISEVWNTAIWISTWVFQWTQSPDNPGNVQR